MAYSQKNSLGIEYFLNMMPVVLKNKGKSVVYYFSRSHRPETSLDSVPEGMEVFESPKKSHILLLRNIKHQPNAN